VKALAMKSGCLNAMAQYERMGLDPAKAVTIFVTPKGWRAPQGFPRRTLMEDNADGSRIVSCNASAVLKWIETN